MDIGANQKQDVVHEKWKYSLEGSKEELPVARDKYKAVWRSVMGCNSTPATELAHIPY